MVGREQRFGVVECVEEAGLLAPGFVERVEEPGDIGGRVCRQEGEQEPLHGSELSCGGFFKAGAGPCPRACGRPDVAFYWAG